MKVLTIHCDGGARGNPGPAAGAFVVTAGDELIYEKGFRLGERTNNQAEYEAVVGAMQWLVGWGGQVADYDEIEVVLDSKLVAMQLAGKYKIKNEELKKRFIQVKIKEARLPVKVKYINVPRAKNARADFLLNQELDSNG